MLSKKKYYCLELGVLQMVANCVSKVHILFTIKIVSDTNFYVHIGPLMYRVHLDAGGISPVRGYV